MPLTSHKKMKWESFALHHSKRQMSELLTRGDSPETDREYFEYEYMLETDREICRRIALHRRSRRVRNKFRFE